MVLIILSCAWVLGLYLGSMFKLPPLLMLAGLAPLPFFFLKAIDRKKIILTSLAVFLLIGGAWYSWEAQHDYGEGRISYYNDGGAAEIRGVIVADPDVRDKSVRLTIEAGEINLGEGWREAEGKILATVPRYPEYEYGDVLLLTGEPETPPVLDDFDYRGYLEHQGVYTVMSFPSVEVADTGRGIAPLAWIFDLRENLAETLGEALPEPQAALAQGILLGKRAGIPGDLDEAFASSGTTHLLAISGYNLTIMAGILLAAGLWLLGRRHYLYVWLAMVAIWFYAIITGLNPPVVRGAVMASIFLIVEFLGRQRSGAAALFLTAAVMTAIHPYILGDASFQLSFMAMAGLIFVHPVISGWGKGVVEKRLGESGWPARLCNLFIDTFSVSIAAIIGVWPVIAYYFGMFSWTGALATFLLTPVQPFIIVFGMLTALGGLIWSGIGQFFGWILWPFLEYMTAVVRGLGGSAAAAAVTWMTPGLIAGYYLILALVIWFFEWRQRTKSLLAGSAGFMKSGVNLLPKSVGKMGWVVIPLVLAALLTTFTAATLPDANLRVSFLDVGEGDAILLQKGATQILIDGGPSPQAVTLALSEAMPFWDRTIDVVILTHLHQDHIAGLMEVLKRYKVKTVVYPEYDYSSPYADEWERLLDGKGIERVAAETGRQIKMGDILIKVLNPPGVLYSGTESDVDNNSAAVLVEAGEIRFLLTGDMMAEAERELMWSRAGVDCMVLKAGHHGSGTSTTAGFLAAADPQIAVISCGEGNKHGHPDEEVVERLGEWVGEANVYRTDLNGTITFTTDGEKLWVRVERE